MKIINGLVMVLCLTQLTMAKSPFKLDVGSQQTILLGETLDLNGKVLSGDKSKIDYYQWEENGKVIKNSSGDEIIYWDDANAENGYAPKVKGNHTLKCSSQSIRTLSRFLFGQLESKEPLSSNYTTSVRMLFKCA